ncbi:unnamed protein product [Brassica oleracea var. botrytis]
MDIWVTNKIDTDTALKWSKSFTLDLSDWFCLPISFLLDEEKKMALFYIKRETLHVVLANGHVAAKMMERQRQVFSQRIHIIAP